MPHGHAHGIGFLAKGKLPRLGWQEEKPQEACPPVTPQTGGGQRRQRGSAFRGGWLPLLVRRQPHQRGTAQAADGQEVCFWVPAVYSYRLGN